MFRLSIVRLRLVHLPGLELLLLPRSLGLGRFLGRLWRDRDQLVLGLGLRIRRRLGLQIGRRPSLYLGGRLGVRLGLGVGPLLPLHQVLRNQAHRLGLLLRARLLELTPGKNLDCRTLRLVRWLGVNHVIRSVELRRKDELGLGQILNRLRTHLVRLQLGFQPWLGLGLGLRIGMVICRVHRRDTRGHGVVRLDPAR